MSLQLADSPIEYLRGSEALQYNIAQESPYGSVITIMAPELGGQT